MTRLATTDLVVDARRHYRSLERNYRRANGTKTGLVRSLTRLYNQAHPDMQITDIDCSSLLRRFVTGASPQATYSPDTKSGTFLVWIATEVDPHLVLHRRGEVEEQPVTSEEAIIEDEVDEGAEPIEPDINEDYATSLTFDAIELDRIILSSFVATLNAMSEVFNPRYILRALQRCGVSKEALDNMVRIASEE